MLEGSEPSQESPKPRARRGTGQEGAPEVGRRRLCATCLHGMPLPASCFLSLFTLPRKDFLVDTRRHRPPSTLKASDTQRNTQVLRPIRIHVDLQT